MMQAILSLINEHLIDGVFASKTSTTLVLGSSVVVLFVTYYFRKWLEMKNYFKKMNVQAPTPWPIVGNMPELIRNKPVYNDMVMIRKYGKICGFFEGSTPCLIVADLKLLKNIFTKDFNYFVNRRVFEGTIDERFDKFLNVLKDDEWKSVRAIVSTSFTSGKLKSLSKYILNCVKIYENHLADVVEKDGLIMTKKFFGGYTLDVICSCGFGIDTNSIEDPNNDFIVHLQNVFNTISLKNPKFILAFVAPKLCGFLTRNNLMEIFPKKSIDFMKTVSNEIIERRRQKLEKRDDFIQNMVDHDGTQTSEELTSSGSKKYLRKTLDSNEILAQALLFFSAGYESTAAALEWTSYNLATHPQIQQRLINEIDSVLDKHNGEINYESVGEIKYLDMVIEETLRMYPPASRSDRVASDDYEYNGLKIEKGQLIAIPIYAIQHDPEIYENPDEFDPERFSDENRKKRDNETFLPFGYGPRHCLGMRFALLEIKLILTTILSKYRFEKCDQTPEKVVLDDSGLMKNVTPIGLKITHR